MQRPTPFLRLTHKDSHTTREARNTQATRNRSVFKYLCALEQATPLSKLPGLPLYDGPLSPLHSCSEKGNTVIRVSSQQTLAERISGPNVSQGWMTYKAPVTFVRVETLLANQKGKILPLITSKSGGRDGSWVAHGGLSVANSCLSFLSSIHRKAHNGKARLWGWKRQWLIFMRGDFKILFIRIFQDNVLMTLKKIKSQNNEILMKEKIFSMSLKSLITVSTNWIKINKVTKTKPESLISLGV